MSAPDYKVVSADDWQGIYINGELRFEGHSIPNWVWIEIVDELLVDHKVDQTDYESDYAYKIIDDNGRCPVAWPAMGGR